MGRRSTRRTQRDNISIANRDLLPSVYLRPIRVTPLEDRRNYFPDPLVRPAGYVGVRSVRSLNINAIRRGRERLGRDVFSFNDPKRVLICARRQERKEVLHALGKTGRGGRKRNRRRNEYSDISCR